MSTSDDLYKQILSDEPSPKTLLHVLTKLKEQGQLNRVIQECLRALNAYPNDVHIRRLLAETYYEAGLISLAEAELEKVTSLIANLTGVFKLQAELYKKQKRENEAAEALKLYLVHRPDDQEALDLFEKLRAEELTPPPEPEPAAEKVPIPTPLAEPEPALEEVSPPEPLPPEPEELPEIATATLAEIYFDQGQMEEAVETYERVIEADPEDERSRQRLQELKAMLEPPAEMEEREIDTIREKKERLIAILERWLANIREQSGISMA